MIKHFIEKKDRKRRINITNNMIKNNTSYNKINFNYKTTNN